MFRTKIVDIPCCVLLSLSLTALTWPALGAPRTRASASSANAAAQTSKSKASPTASATPGSKSEASSAKTEPTKPATTSTPTATPAKAESEKKAASEPASSEASAEETQPDPATVKKARELWYRGVEAFRQARYEEARQAFEECYKLMPKSDVLRNLSISELQSGHYVSAARHLRQLLAPPNELPEKVREEALERLSQAEAQVGQLSFSVDVNGAEIIIDQQSIGFAPLADSWYLEPGQHEILIVKAGYPADQRHVVALAGVNIPISVSLEDLRREQANDAQAARLMGTNEGQARVDSGVGPASTVLLITGGVLAAAALTGGILFTVDANAHKRDAGRIASRLPGTQACNSETLFSRDCEALSRELEDRRTSRQAAILSFVGLGVVSAATLGYASWLIWGDDKSDGTDIAPSASVWRDGAILGAQGSF